MIKPPFPSNEVARLAALRRYGLLNTEKEQNYDDLTFLASVICNTPIALLTLVDEQRQWFKSRVGLDNCETHRDVSFCAHAIMQPELFVVEDASQDPRFKDNPLVTGEPLIRFYAGMPLFTSEGFALGTLCVIDRVPRKLSGKQEEALKILARQAVRQFELRRASSDLSVALDDAANSEDRLIRFARELDQDTERLQDELSSVGLKLQTEASARTVAEDRFRRSQRMELIGRLACGVAHDLNNLLGIIGAYSDHLRKSDSQMLPGAAEAISNAVERATKLTRDLLTLSRTKSGLPGVIHLNDFITGEKAVIEKLAGSRIKVNFELNAELPCVQIDASQVEQALLNLVLNARDAMPQGGTISIKTGVRWNETLTPGETQCGFEDKTHSEQYSVIEVSDTGEGMTPEVKAHLFEPFFTTKPAGKGTGLGLSLICDVMKTSGGFISVESEPGRGTRFILYFPCSEAAIQSGVSAKAAGHR